MNLKTLETNTKFGWTVLLHSSHCLNLANSDIHLLGALNYEVCGTKFETDDDVTGSVRAWLHE
jgi:hypothetical protein